MPEPNHPPPSPRQKDFPYFRRIWKNVVVALLATSFIPLILIGGGMYYYASRVLKQKTLEALHAEVQNHKELIDRFLVERTRDLKLLAKNIDRKNLIRPGALEHVFASLQKELPCFQDIGIIDDQGRHLAYVGPYSLITRNYKKTFWFKAVKERGIYISDVFLGFRNIPHFVIAVRETSPDGFWILRATVDTDFFNAVVSGITRNDNGDSFLINRHGIFQTVPRRTGRLMGPSAFSNLNHFDGVRLKQKNGLLQVMVWLENVPWLCVVQDDSREIFRDLHRVRNIGIFAFILGSILIGFTVLLTTNYLIGRLESKRRNIQALDHQLQHTSRQASSMTLSKSMFTRLKDVLARIELNARQLQDLSGPPPDTGSPDARIFDGAGQIRSQAFSGRKAIDNFLNVIRPVAPMIREINVNELMDNLLDLFEREFHFSRIRLVREYQQPAVVIRSDPTRLRQVFQNLIFNAMNAIRLDGEISIRIGADNESLSVAITDDGPGIPDENLAYVLNPHFTTRPEGMGLGLSICRHILNKLGGQLSVENIPGKGASFRVRLPILFRLPGS